MIYYKIIETISAYSILLPILLGIIRFSLLYPSQYYMFLFWLVCSSVVNLLNAILADNGINNLAVFHLYTLLEFVLLSLIYRSVTNSKILRKATTLAVVAFFIFKILDVSIIGNLDQTDTLAMIIESVVMIAFSMIYFSQLIEVKNTSLAKLPMFWINAAILIYFSGSFFLFLFSTYIFSDAEQYYEYWPIHNILVIIRNVLFAVAMLILDKSGLDRTHQGSSLATHS